MQDKIVDLLEKESFGLSFPRMCQKLKIYKISEIKKLSQQLVQLQKENVIYLTKKQKYMLMSNSHLIQGELSVNKKGFAFLRMENCEEDIFIEKNKLNGAIDQDTVMVERIKDRNHRDAGRVVKIVKRNLTTLIGEYVDKGHYGDIILDEEKVKLNIRVNKKDSLGAVSGHKVVVEVISANKKGFCYGKIIDIIGHKNAPGVDIATIAAKYNFPREFSPEVLEEATNVPVEVTDKDIINRRDLRDKIIFTIDGNDTKDIDDAISCYKNDDGSYFLGVYIADLGAYVKEGSNLDKEAYRRGTSAYLADSVIPMYPVELSNGICSLNPNVDRLAIGCEMQIDQKGNVITYEIFPTVIKSRKQMTYDKVNDILENNIVDEDYRPYEEMIYTMKELSTILRNNKYRRGYIEFESSEVKIKVDENGKPIDIIPRVQRTGEKIIEDFMIVANETVATYMNEHDLPFIYRIHGKPTEERVEELLKSLSVLGINVIGTKENFNSNTISEVLKSITDEKMQRLVSSMMLRTMQKAVYAENNIGHFGLGSEIYCHFTSPIRRYPDTMVNRLLHKLVFEQQSNLTSKYESVLPNIAEHSSTRERAAVDCEREVNDMKMAEYMEEKIGNIYPGMVSSITKFGMFIELENLVEGLVRVTSLKNDYFEYNQELLALVGKSTKKMYRLGDNVTVKVVAASKINKTIDFEIVENKEALSGNQQS